MQAKLQPRKNLGRRLVPCAPPAPASLKDQMQLTKHWAAMLDDYAIDLGWSPDGTLLAAASAASPVSLFAVADGARRTNSPATSKAPTACAWSSAGALDRRPRRRREILEHRRRPTHRYRRPRHCVGRAPRVESRHPLRRRRPQAHRPPRRRHGRAHLRRRRQIHHRPRRPTRRRLRRRCALRWRATLGCRRFRPPEPSLRQRHPRPRLVARQQVARLRQPRPRASISGFRKPTSSST